jgi:hypothetical protein
MFSKQEAAALRQEFWTTFGRYLAPIPSAGGGRANWVNYKTGVRDIQFRMDADNKRAIISIELTHKDPGVQELVFAQFEELKTLLHNTLGETWTWEPQVRNEHGQRISRVFCELENVSVFRREDWPAMIAFFKQRIIALDEFWSMARDIFEELQ